MFKRMKNETKVGIFALACLVIIAYATIKLSDTSVVAGGGYKMAITMDSAVGIKPKTPVEIAGVQVGVVKKIGLDDNGLAKVVLLIDNAVRVPEGTTAYTRAKGFLGQTFIELRLGSSENKTMVRESEIPYGGITGDFNLLLSQFNEISKDIKSVTGSLKDMIGPDDASPVYRTVNNLDQFSEVMKEIAIRNEANFDRVVNNLAILTDELRGVIENRRRELEDTVANISSITQKVDEGKGTIGRLVNDDTTVNKLNDAVDSLNSALGGLKRLQTEIGYHTEYLGASNDFKHYVHLNFLPAPDKGFLFEFVSDPSASPTRVTRDTTITAGGATSNITTHSATVEQDRFRFSAELAKKFYDFTLRGGIIESTGGVGLDYDKGPLGLQFSAFDFDTKYGQKPHLKAWGSVNVLKGIYFVGGADDFINPNQPVDWFVGAGFRLVDEDVKGLLGLGARAIK